MEIPPHPNLSPLRLRWSFGGREGEAKLPACGLRGVEGCKARNIIWGNSNSLVLLAWLIFAEVGTECWYRVHESHLGPPVTWTVRFPPENVTVRLLPFSKKARQFLRYDEALNASWDDDGRRFQAIFLRWKPGRTAAHLARTHTPEACVTAAGRNLLSKSDLRLFPASGLELPFRRYVFDDPQGPLHVYYCLWEDRVPHPRFDSTRLTYNNRLESVLAGRRLCGQRSLEIAVWGIGDDETADDAVAAQLAKSVTAISYLK